MKNTPLMGDLYFVVRFLRQKKFTCYTKNTPTTGTHLISAFILNHCRTLRSLSREEEEMNIHPTDRTSYVS